LIKNKGKSAKKGKKLQL